MGRANQISLPLRAAPRWGGRRAGAGRKPGAHPRIRHRSRARFPARYPCHVTLKVRSDLPSLRSARFLRALERSWADLGDRGEFRVTHYSLQPDHAHVIVEAKSRDALGRGMKSIAARFARAANRAFRRSGPVLADRFHLRVLRTPLEVRRALAYVLLNGRRHAAAKRRALASGRVDPASSGAWFDGWKAAKPVPSPRATGPPPVAPPHSWLLRVGWRRHGLLDPREIPGGRSGPAKRRA